MTDLYYAGIGSRGTPSYILNIMINLGSYLYEQGWTLRSGAAEGADSAFELGHDHVATEPRKEIYIPWKNFNWSNSPLHRENVPFTDQEMLFAGRFHPAWHKCSPSARLLHARNTRQILGCEQLHGPVVVPSKFVVCWTKDGKLQGGTAQALRIAEAMGVKIFNLGKPSNSHELEAIIHELDAFQAEFTAQKEPA